MEETLVASPVEYLVREDGQRTGVVLRWDDYQALCANFPADPDKLVGLGDLELRALAEGMLSSRYQQRLDELLQHNREAEMSDAEECELDRLLEYIDHMNVLKARAGYTLQRLNEAKVLYGVTTQPPCHYERFLRSNLDCRNLLALNAGIAAIPIASSAKNASSQ